MEKQRMLEKKDREMKIREERSGEGKTRRKK